MIKTSELIEKLIIASEKSYKCEDENFNRMVEEIFKGKSIEDSVSIADMTRTLRVITEFSRFSSIRTTCKVLQDLGIIEADVNVLNNDDFRNALNVDMFK